MASGISTCPHWVSIHAHVKGATTRLAWLITNTYVSIHAPVKGATCY